MSSVEPSEPAPTRSTPRIPSLGYARPPATGRPTTTTRPTTTGERCTGPPQYPAICADCGKQTTVPFQPRGDKPILCGDCFRRSRGRR